MKVIIEEYVEYVEHVKMLTKWTVKIYEKYLLRFNTYCESVWITDLSDITIRTITWFSKVTQNRKNKWSIYYHKWESTIDKNTVIYHLRCVRKFLERCRICDIPTLHYKLVHIPKQDQKRIQSLSPDDLKLVLQAPFKYERFKFLQLRNYILLCFWYYCWLRINETLSLDINDIKWLDFVNVKGKWWHIGQIMIHNVMKEPIREFLKLRVGKYSTQPLICSYKNKKAWERLEYDGVRAIVRKYNKHLWLKVRFHYHQLRHTLATTLATAGEQAFIIQKVMRHRCIKSTQVYPEIWQRLIKSVLVNI